LNFNFNFDGVGGEHLITLQASKACYFTYLQENTYYVIATKKTSV
jgi:hypothetical protein